MQELADFLNVSLSAVSKIEKGYRRIDQEQLVRIAEFLDCPIQDIFVNESSSQPDVVQAWRREQERRNRVNERSGLKTLGAGLRHIRGQKNMTLADVADGAGLTLSVYHRIEMGQREVSEDEFLNVAKSLEHSPDELQRKIYELDKGGSLDEFIQRNDARYRTISGPKGGFSDLAAGRGSVRSSEKTEVRLPVYGQLGEKGFIVIDKTTSTGTVVCPSGISNSPKAYGLNLCTRRLGNLLPTRSILVIDPSQMVGLGDIAVLYENDREARLISIREDMNGNLYGVQWNPEEKVEFSQENLSALHRVVFIFIP
jgi:transcriptional regulator with XRE-family HTH domain